MALLTVARTPIGSASATVRTAIEPLAGELNEKIYRPQQHPKLTGSKQTAIERERSMPERLG
jgi:hypothetical protein